MFEEKVKFAVKWFEENNVEIPLGAKEWSKKSVKNKEIPPKCTYQTLRRNGINLSDFIAAITNKKSKKVNYSPINKENCIDKCGLKWVDHVIVKGHKKVNTKCINCGHIEQLDYGTLQRMVAANNTYCRVCREAGGKEKPLYVYDRFEDFTVISFVENNKVKLSCNNCANTITRGKDYTLVAEYLVCDYCSINGSKQVTTELGIFDSKIEYTIYKYLLTFLSEEDIVKQPKYKELFTHIYSNHRADFYIKSLDLILEITTSRNNISKKYKENLEFKQSISDKVIVITSIKEVKDIVRPLVKANG